MCSILMLEGTLLRNMKPIHITAIFNILREYGTDGFGIFISRIDGLYKIVNTLDPVEFTHYITVEDLQHSDFMIFHTRAGTVGDVDIVNIQPICTVSSDRAWITFMRGTVEREDVPPELRDLYDTYISSGLSDTWFVHELCMRKMFHIVESFQIDMVHIYIKKRCRRIKVLENSGEAGKSLIENTLVFASPRDVIPDVESLIETIRKVELYVPVKDMD